MKIETVAPDAAIAAQIVRDYMVDVASRWYRRPATNEEVNQALHDEPYEDLQGLTGMLLVAVEGGQPLGCAGVRFLGNVAELTKVFTLPSYRGRGVGSQLLRAVEQACRGGRSARSVSTLARRWRRHAPCTSGTDSSASTPSATSFTPTAGTARRSRRASDRRSSIGSWVMATLSP